MSALAMILTAAMVVPGNGPEMESGEIEQGLDLNGEWKGSLRREQPDGTVSVTYQDGKLTIMESKGPESFKVVFIDQGKGKCRCRIVEDDAEGLGIYKWQGDHLFICVGGDGQSRPANYTVEKDNSLLILHRVKPRK